MPQTFVKRFLLVRKSPPADLQDLPLKSNVRFEYVLLAVAVLLVVLLVGVLLHALR